jgi:hypothetical protein
LLIDLSVIHDIMLSMVCWDGESDAESSTG